MSVMSPSEVMDLQTYAQIKDKEAIQSQVSKFADVLGTDIGGRLTGSPNLKKAISWASTALSDLGFQNVHLEDWGEFGEGWTQLAANAEMTVPDHQTLWIQASPWSVPTHGRITAELVHIDPEHFNQGSLHGKLRGKIVLLGAARQLPPMTGPLVATLTVKDFDWMAGSTQDPVIGEQERQKRINERSASREKREQLLSFLIDQGVRAVLLPSPVGHGSGSGLVFVDNSSDLIPKAFRAHRSDLPTAVVIPEHWNRLVRLVDAGRKVRVAMYIATAISGKHEHGYNVLAELPGTDPDLKNQVVLLGAHLDSWASGTGAADNGAGVAVVMEALRLLKALGRNPRRTIRIALWTGEEQGSYGSYAYVGRHLASYNDPEGVRELPGYLQRHGTLSTRPEWSTFDAYYNLDAGSGTIAGIYTVGNKGAGAIFSQWIAPLADLGVTVVSQRKMRGSDQVPFDDVGLPGFFFIQEPLDYETRVHHSNVDTFDHLDINALKQAAIVTAIFAWNTSQRNDLLPRQPLQ